jgi:hypothetical protein
MTLDFSTMPPPEEWDRFNAMIQRRMPRAPDMGDGAGTPMGDALMVAGAATSGLGDTLPPGVGTVVGLAGTTYSVGSTLSRGDVEGAAGALGDDLISRGADLVLAGEGGWLVGGLIMLARGAHQSLSRSDAVVTYLNSMGGYIHTLVRAAIAAVNDPYPYTRMPMPVVPSYVEETGDLATSFARDAFTAGYNQVREIVRDIDSVRPPSGDYPSKRCLMYIGLQTNMTGGSGTMSSGALRLQMRQRAERYVVRDLLRVDMARQANALRRWATAH